MTAFILLTVVVLLIIYDVIIVLAKGKDATISVVSYELSKKFPLIPFLLGFVFGHILWPH